MQCPIDGETLVMADRNGVEIDYCPKCRGVWLDRGELDKIVERAAGPRNDERHEDRRGYRREDRRDDRRDDSRHHSDDREGRGNHGKHRESFLSDLFDF